MTESQKWMLLVGASVLAWLFYLLAPILTPFLLAFLFAYLGNPFVLQLEQQRHMSRTLAVILVFTALFAIIILVVLLILPLLERQVVQLIHQLPTYHQWITQKIKLWVEAEQIDMYQMLVQQWQKAGGIVVATFNYVTQSGLVLAEWVANLVLVPVLTFYLMRDWSIMLASIQGLLPRFIEAKIVSLAKESDQVLSAFLRGQMMVMLCLGALYSFGLWLIDVNYSLIIGMLSGFVSFVPYLGFIIGILSAGVAAIVQFQALQPLVYVLMVFGVVQAIEAMLLTPLFVGDKIGLHPVAVIFALLAGGQLYGFFGILLALPVSAVLMVFLRHAHQRYQQSSLYQSQTKLSTQPTKKKLEVKSE